MQVRDDPDQFELANYDPRLYAEFEDKTAALARDIDACDMCGAIGKHKTVKCDAVVCNMKNCL